MAWVFGIFVLVWLWWESATARTFWQTAIACAALIASAATGYASARSLWLILRRARPGGHLVTKEVRFLGPLWVVAPLLFVASHSRTYEGSEWIGLAPVQLAEARLVERPEGWLNWAHAKREFQVEWCRREGIAACDEMGGDEARFEEEWRARRRDQVNGLKKPGLNPVTVTGFESAMSEAEIRLTSNHFEDPSPPEAIADFTASQSRRALNLRGVDLRRGFLSGISLTAVRLGRAQLSGANLESAYLPGAQLQDADLSGAQLQGADLSGAQLQEADLSGAQLQDADLSGAQLQKAELRRAQLQKADLRRAQLQDAILIQAQLQRAMISGAQLRDAVLFEAQLQEVNLGWANLQGANLSGANLQGAVLFEAQLQEANLSRANLQGANLNGARLQGANLNEAQLQGAVWHYALLTGSEEQSNPLISANLTASTNHGGALKYVVLSRAIFDTRSDWRNVFLDGSVVVSPAYQRFTVRGSTRPCQWVKDIIEKDADFYSLWRWWTARVRGRDIWRAISPEGFEDIPPASPELRAKYGIPEDCAPQRGPLKTFPGPHGP